MMRQRNTAFDDTLFTFCPPGPPLRANVTESSTSGMTTRSVTRIMPAVYAVDVTYRRVNNGAVGRPRLASIAIETPERLLAAAEAAFADDGLDGATLHDIAARA